MLLARRHFIFREVEKFLQYFSKSSKGFSRQMFLDSIFPTRRGILSTLVLGILILSIAIVVVIIVGEISKIKQRNSYFNEANMGG